MTCPPTPEVGMLCCACCAGEPNTAHLRVRKTRPGSPPPPGLEHPASRVIACSPFAAVNGCRLVGAAHKAAHSSRDSMHGAGSCADQRAGEIPGHQVRQTPPTIQTPPQQECRASWLDQACTHQGRARRAWQQTSRSRHSTACTAASVRAEGRPAAERPAQRGTPCAADSERSAARARVSPLPSQATQDAGMQVWKHLR